MEVKRACEYTMKMLKVLVFDYGIYAGVILDSKSIVNLKIILPPLHVCHRSLITTFQGSLPKMCVYHWIYRCMNYYYFFTSFCCHQLGCYL